MVEVAKPVGAPAAKFIVDAVGDVARPHAGLPPRPVAIDAMPGKRGLPRGIAYAVGWMRHGRAFLVEQSRRFGAVYKDQFANIPAVMVSDPELVAEITRNEDRVWSAALAWRLFFEGLDPSAPRIDSPVALDFEPHKDSRRLLMPAFSGAALESYIDVAIPMFERAIDGWVARGSVAFKADARRLFAKVAGRIFMGVEDDAQAEFLDHQLAAFWQAPLAIVRNRYVSRTWRRAQRGHRSLYDWLMKQVPERRRGKGTDLFTRMCQTAPDVAWIDDEALVRLFMGVLGAAFDTTSCAVTSMAYELARNPDWQTRLRDEVRTVEPTYDGVRRLESVEHAWKETLRLYPVAADVPRRALRDVELGGYRIPAGTVVFALVAATSNDPKLWKEPQRFDPERFARGEDKQLKGAYMPFGGGAHACIGAQLSTLEAKAFWHVMLSKCRFELAKPYDARHQFLPLGIVSGDVGLALHPC